MAKPLFKNYSFQLDKNEKKILLQFCKTIQKQMSADERFYSDLRTFNSIIDKINDPVDEMKLTKDEKTKLVFRLKENIDHMKKQVNKGFFLKRWLYKSAYNQYKNLLETHFSN